MAFKRFLIGFLWVSMGLAITMPAQALQVQGYPQRYSLESGSQPLNELTITMDNLSEPILAAHGITLLLSETQWILWEKNVASITVSGNAVEAKKIAPEPAVTYLQDLKAVNIPVLANWTVDDGATIAGLKIRVYDRGSAHHPLAFDITGDGLADYTSSMTIAIDETNTRTDTTSPYPPDNFTVTSQKNPLRVELSWIDPLDYDFKGFDLERRVNGGAVEKLLEFSPAVSATDLSVKAGDQIEYWLYSLDKHKNRSEPKTILITVEALPQAAETPGESSEIPNVTQNQPEPPAAEPPQSNLPAEEQTLLNRLFSSYRIRYQIKCNPGGKAAKPSDSACLWAKIDLIYAQNRLSRSELSVGLTANDLRLMALRLPLNRNRYETKCTAAANTPAFCPALLRAVSRAEYLLNQNQ